MLTASSCSAPASELVEEGTHRLLRSPLPDPDRVAGVVVSDDGEVLVALEVAHLVDADAVQPLKAGAVELPRHHPLDDVADRGPGDVEEVLHRRLVHLASHPGDQVLEVAGARGLRLLLSRCRGATLRALTEEEIAALVERAVSSPQGLGGDLALSDGARELFARYAYGDARRALNALEVAAAAVRLAGGKEVLPAHAEEAMQHKALLYDKGGEQHYDVVSAFIKSLRGSDPDAAVYYLVRMLEGGEDPRFILRRMVIFASEDVGNADPRALGVAVDALQAVELVGIPEGVLPMSQAAIYLALAPKSNTALTSYTAARRLVGEKGPLPVPMKLRNAPTKLMESLGYGGGYRYPHNFEGHYVAERYLPDAIRDEVVVKLSGSGLEKELAERLAALRKRDREE